MSSHHPHVALPHHRISVSGGAGTQKSGYLSRPEGPFKIYKKRWFELRGVSLFYFKDESVSKGGASASNGCLQVGRAKVKALSSGNNYFAFGLTQLNSSRMYIMHAPSEEERIEWLTALVHAGAIVNDKNNNKLPTVPLSISATNALIAAVVDTGDRRMFPSSSHEGWLNKLGGVKKNHFQQRYFVLVLSQLLYYTEPIFPRKDRDTEEDLVKKARGTIDLNGAVISIESNSLELYNQQYVFSLIPSERRKHSLMTSLWGQAFDNYVFACRDSADLHTWVNVLQKQSVFSYSLFCFLEANS
jgi:hypothetical protein